MCRICSELNERILEWRTRINQRMVVEGLMKEYIYAKSLSIRGRYPVPSIDEALPQKWMSQLEIKLRCTCHSAQGFCSGTPALVHSQKPSPALEQLHISRHYKAMELVKKFGIIICSQNDASEHTSQYFTSNTQHCEQKMQFSTHFVLVVFQSSQAPCATTLSKQVQEYTILAYLPMARPTQSGPVPVTRQLRKAKPDLSSGDFLN